MGRRGEMNGGKEMSGGRESAQVRGDGTPGVSSYFGWNTLVRHLVLGYGLTHVSSGKGRVNITEIGIS